MELRALCMYGILLLVEDAPDEVCVRARVRDHYGYDHQLPPLPT